MPRSVSALPFGEPAMRVTNARAWKVFVTLSGFLCAGCTVSLPVALNDMRNLKETVHETDREEPQLSLTIHPDGLGWQVFVSQAVTRKVETSGDEYWQYRSYDLSGRSRPGRPENYDDVCGPLLLTTPFFAHLNVEEPPYWSRWDRWASACRMTDVNSSAILRDRRVLRRETHERLEAVTEGELRLVWQAPGQLAVQARIPLSHNQLASGTAVRLRWLAEIIRRTARPPMLPFSGAVELQLVQQERTVLRKRLVVSAADLIASLNDERVISVSAEHWPHEFVVRIDQELSPLSGEERAQIVQQAVGTLSRLALPVVLRGRELERWRADQVRFHYPQFHDQPSVDAAHAIGATLLLHLEMAQPYPQARVLTMHVASIETGEMLATLTTGGHESQWAAIVEMGMKELGFLLQHQQDQQQRSRSMVPTLLGKGEP